jgi:histidyl-tRNA synthetase
LPYAINHTLVRGLDYYTKTVFEIRETTDNLALCGGGRYDYLTEVLGGKHTPAVGAAAGIERLVDVLKKRQPKQENNYKPKAFLVLIGDLPKKKGLSILEMFRKANIWVVESFGKDSVKSQLRQADRLAAPFALILGQKEAMDDTIILRDMKSGVQEVIGLDKITEELKKRFKNGIV